MGVEAWERVGGEEVSPEAKAVAAISFGGSVGKTLGSWILPTIQRWTRTM